MSGRGQSTSLLSGCGRWAALWRRMAQLASVDGGARA
jgi:hypothetical protein